MYKVESPINKAMGGMNEAAGTYSKMRQDIPANRDPGPTATGAVTSGAGGAMAGAQIGTTATTTTAATAAAGGAAKGSAAGWYGAAIGAVIGIGAYLLS